MIAETLTLLWGGITAKTLIRSVGALASQRGFMALPEGENPAVSVIVPVRNEERNIRRLLESLLRQETAEIVIVNDGSTDRTAQIVAELMSRIPQLRLIDAPALPKGWTGKNHACLTGYQNARGEVLAFIDADVALTPGAVRQIAARLKAAGLGLVSAAPAQEIVGAGERLLLPGLFMSVVATLDFRAVNNPASKAALANGQVLFFSREAYEQIGTHRAVADVVGEDAALAVLVKNAGRKSYFFYDDGHLATVRMYRSFAECWSGFKKNLSEIVGVKSSGGLIAYAAQTLWLSAGALIVPALMIGGFLQGAFFWLGAGISAVWWGMALGSLVAMRVPLYYVAAIPFSLAASAWLALVNYRLRKTGGRQWKGRVY